MRILITLFSLLSMIQLSFGGTIHVPADQPTIQAAIDASSNDGIIIVSSGLYQENLDYNGKSLKVLGSGSDVTTLEPPVSNLSAVRIASGEGSGTEFRGFMVVGGNGETIIFVGNGANPTISQCIFRDYVGSGDNDVVIRVTSDAVIEHNLFYDNGGISCIGISDGGRADIINNTFDNNRRGFHTVTGRGRAINNIMSNSAQYGIYGEFEEQDYNCVWNNSPDYDGGASAGANNIPSDPLYFDLSADDYSLSFNSPCIDAGHPDLAFSDPDGTRNDMGAYFFIQEYPIVIDINLGTEDKYHVLNHTPSVYWTILDPEGSQESYEIEVGIDNDWSVAEMWATGEVISLDTSVVYSGSELDDGQTYYLRIRAYNGTDWSGWSPFSFHMNSIPSEPVLVSPINQETVPASYVNLVVLNSTDFESDGILYDFEVYSDPGLIEMVYSEFDVVEQSDSTVSGLVPGLEEDSEYWWRARVTDGYEYSSWVDAASFIASAEPTIYVPADQPTIQAAIDASFALGTIIVAPGLYCENLNFNGKMLKVLGSGSDVTTLEPLVSSLSAVRMVSGEGSGTEFSGFMVVGGSGTNVILIDNGAHPTISQCIFRAYDSKNDDDVVIRVRSDAVIERNLFYDNGGISCIGISDGGRADIINNTFDNNRRGFHSVTGRGRAINNIVSNSAQYGIFGEFEEQNYNCVWNNSPDYDGGASAGANNVSSDPQYFDVSANDYNILINSPCLNAGHPDPAYNDPDGTRNDMGAFPMALTLPIAFRINLGEEYEFNVVNHFPTIYWSFLDEIGTQQAFEIEIGTDEDWSVAEMWATGEVTSSDTSVVYAGAPLEDGVNYYLRIRVNNGVEWGGWSDFMFRMNYQPTAPAPITPENQQQVSIYQLYLGVENSMDSDSDTLGYDFEVYRDAALTSLHDIMNGIPEQSPVTLSEELENLSIETNYWWRARSYDGYEYSEWSEVWSFTAIGAQVVKVPIDYQTIQGAIDAVNDGDVVIVESGTYLENVNFGGKDVKVMGIGPENVTLTPADIYQPAVIFGSGEERFAQISGFTISGGTGNSLILVGGGAEPTITQNTFTGFALDKDNDVVIRVTSGATITKNLFYNNGGISCIGISSGGTASIINNTFDNNRRGIHTVTDRGVVLNNIITNSVDYGIYGNFEVCDYNCVWSNNPNYESGAEPGPHDISEDPLYLGIEYAMYFLNAVSPCIDAGHPDPVYNDPDGSRNDMGAFTFDVSELPLPINIQICGQDLMHIINHMSNIYWTYIDAAQPMQQAAYEMEVGIDDDWAEAEMWATGMVISIDTIALYLGEPLIDGETYYLRLRVHNGDKWGAWRELIFRMNSKPAIPATSWPPSNSELDAFNVNLSVANSTDAEGDNLSYSFAIYSASNAFSLVSQRDGVAEEDNYTSSGPMYGVEGGRQYWWRARAFDGYENSYWTPFDSFTTSQNFVINVPQDLGSIQAAINVATDGDVILVGPGQYSEEIDFSGKEIRLISSDGPDNTILQRGEGTESLITIASGEGPFSEVSGFTINGGPYETLDNVELILIANNSSPIITQNIFHDFTMPISSDNVVIRSDNSTPNITRNLFYSNSCSGCIGLEGEGAARIVNNTFDENHRGFYSLSSEAVAMNNIISGSADYGICGQFATCDYNCLWQNQSNYACGTVAGANSIDVDPLYIDNIIREYRLYTNSPCIDAGDPTILVPYYGGEAIDIGRYETYQSGYGDANGDGGVDVGDVVFVVNYVFNGGPEPGEMVLADCNADCEVNVADAVYLINYIFNSGFPPKVGCAYEIRINVDIPSGELR